MLSCPVAQQPPVTLRGRQQQRFIGQGVDKGIGSWGNSAPIGLNLRGVSHGKTWGNKKQIFSGKKWCVFFGIKLLTLLFACLRICIGLYSSKCGDIWFCRRKLLIQQANWSIGDKSKIKWIFYQHSNKKNNSGSILQRPPTSIGSSRYPKPSLGLAARCKISSSDPDWLLASSGLRTPPSGHLNDERRSLVKQIHVFYVDPCSIPHWKWKSPPKKKTQEIWSWSHLSCLPVSSLSPHTFGYQQSKPALTIKLQT